MPDDDRNIHGRNIVFIITSIKNRYENNGFNKAMYICPEIHNYSGYLPWRNG